MLKSLFFASIGCNVVSFEPMPDLTYQIDLSLAMNPKFYDKITLFRNIVSNDTSLIHRLKIIQNNFALSQVVVSEEEIANSIVLPTIKIDDAIKSVYSNWKHKEILLMKVDIEGIFLIYIILVFFILIISNINTKNNNQVLN